VSEIALSLYNSLIQSGIEVLWDDRDDRAGVKFNDADLIGVPYQLIIGDKGLAQGTVEFKLRKDGAVTRLAPDQALKHAQTLHLDGSRAL